MLDRNYVLSVKVKIGGDRMTFFNYVGCKEVMTYGNVRTRLSRAEG